MEGNMGKTNTKRIKLENKIYNYEKKAKKSLIIAVAAFVICAIFIALKLYFTGLGMEWASNDFANMTTFIVAVVAAAFAGIGARDWMRARNEIKALRAKI
jgi:high-affinity Fe2+/Pb2+ permease